MPRTSTRRRREAAEYSKSIQHSKGASEPVRVQEMDLSIVDNAYGDYADLYGDVLRVSATATHEHIQLAYFDRRSELFTLLAKIDAKSPDARTEEERRRAERKMDAVVLAVRILNDPESREEYDQARQGRLLNRRRSKQNHFDGDYSKVGRRATFQEKPVTSEMTYEDERDQNRTSSGRRSKSSSTNGRSSGGRSSPTKSSRRSANLDDTLNTYEMTDEETERDFDRSYLSYETDEFRQDDTTIGSGTIGTMTIGDTTVGSGTIGTNTLGEATLDTYTFIEVDEDKVNAMPFCGGSAFARTLQKEVNGALQDTVASFDQVFNAFTLTDKDIRAVTKRIDKAKRQLDD